MESLGDREWQPTYVYWFASVYISTAVAGIAASLVTPAVFGDAVGWGWEALLSFLRSEGAGGLGLFIAVAMILLLLSVPPGMLSLFLVALSETRLALHPVVGGAFFAIAVGWLLQAIAGALFGLIFGGVSLGGTAAMLALRRTIATRA